MTERDAIYERPEITNDDALAKLEGIVGEEDGYSTESDAAVLLQVLVNAPGPKVGTLDEGGAAYSNTEHPCRPQDWRRRVWRHELTRRR